MVFNHYAKYYNLLYTDKKYNEEVTYILRLIENNSNNSNFLLDVGCGTGKHASILAENGYQVTGIDLSSNMIEIAKSKNYKNCKFWVDNASNFKIEKEFDIITSLFHVISYQTTNELLEEVFFNIRNHMKPDGLFIFDFWYTPAVLTQKPTVKIKRLEDDEIKITRFTEPIHHFNENIVDVNFELHIFEKKTGKYNTINEVHRMRYFSISELDYVLKKCGMKSIKYEEWLTGNSPSEESWGVCCIAKLI